MKQTLFLFLAFPGAGKTTFAKQLAAKTNIPRINADELRRFMYQDDVMLKDTANRPMTFGALDYAMVTLLGIGLSVIYDANTNRREHRQEHAARAAQYGARTILIVIDTPLDIARQREATRELPARYFRIPKEHYDEIVRDTEPPTEDETVITINGLESFDKQYASFCAQLEALS